MTTADTRQNKAANSHTFRFTQLQVFKMKPRQADIKSPTRSIKVQPCSLLYCSCIHDRALLSQHCPACTPLGETHATDSSAPLSIRGAAAVEQL